MNKQTNKQTNKHKKLLTDIISTVCMKRILLFFLCTSFLCSVPSCEHHFSFFLCKKKTNLEESSTVFRRRDCSSAVQASACCYWAFFVFFLLMLSYYNASPFSCGPLFSCIQGSPRLNMSGYAAVFDPQFTTSSPSPSPLAASPTVPIPSLSSPLTSNPSSSTYSPVFQLSLT